MNELSVILVTYQRKDLLKRALGSLSRAVHFAQNWKSDFVVKTYLCINGDDNESLPAALEVKEKNPQFDLQITTLDKAVTPAAARNHLLNLANSSFVFFMDDDVELPPNIFIHFLQLNKSMPAIDVWGGPNLTPHSSSQEKLDNGWFVAQPLIVGPVARRYSLSGKNFLPGNQFNLMLCNLFVRREVIDQQGFEVFFKTAEENELIYRLEKNGSQMASSDLLFVWHERRSSYQNFLKQIFYYGYGRGQLFFRVPIKRQKLFISAPIIVLLTLALFVKAVWLILIWLVTLNIIYLIQFRRLNLVVFFMPPLMWILYCVGLLQGFWFMKKTKLNQNLIKFMKVKI